MIFTQRILPWVIHLAMKNKEATRRRARVVPAAAGRVLEVGFGSGLNLPFYSAAVTMVVGLDPSAELFRIAGKRLGGVSFPVELVNRSAEEIPFDGASFDSVLITWSLCSIADAPRALSEVRRVLKPGGSLIFVEHGLSPDDRVAAWQQRLNPLWRRIAGGCNMNRPIDRLISAAGLRITDLQSGYLLKGPRPLSYTYEGRACPA